MITYRQMTLADVPAVHDIEVATFPTPWSLDSFYYEMNENEYAHYIVAEHEGQIVGFCGLWNVDLETD